MDEENNSINYIYENFVLDKNAFPDFESFNEMYKDATPEELYNVVDPEAFPDVNQFAEMFELGEEKEEKPESSVLTNAVDWLKKSYNSYFPDEKKKKKKNFQNLKKLQKVFILI